MREVLHVMRRYGPATIFTTIALILTLILNTERYPYVLLAGAVVASALYGGLKPGLFATLLAALSLSLRFLFFPGPESHASFGQFAAQLALAVFVGLLASYLGEHCWRAVRATEWLQTALGSAGEGVIFTDKHGQIVFINGVAQEIFGCGQEVVGEYKLDSILRIVDADTRLILPSPVERTFSSHTETRLADPTILISHTGAERPIMGCITPILDRDGTVEGSVMVVRDWNRARGNSDQVSQRKQLEATLDQARQELQKHQAVHLGTVEELQQTRQRHEQEVQELTARLEQAKEVEADRTRLRRELETARKQYDDQMRQHGQNLGQARDALNEAETAFQNKLKEQTAQLKQRLEESQGREKKLQQQTQATRQQLEKDFGARISQLEAERSRLKTELDNAVERELHAEEALVRDLKPVQERLARIEQEKQTLQGKLDNADRQARDHGDRITEQQRIEDQLRQELRDVREAAERHQRHGVLATSLSRSIGGALIALDRQGIALFVNPAAEQILGWKEADVLGRGIHDWLLFPRTDDRQEQLERAGHIVRENELFARRDGGTVRVRCQETPLIVDGHNSGTVISFAPERSWRSNMGRPSRPRPASLAEVVFASAEKSTPAGGLLHQYDEWLDYN